MPQYSPRRHVGLVHKAISDFISRMNRANEYGNADDIEDAFKKFGHARREYYLLIEAQQEIWAYIITLSNEANELRQTSRRLRTDSDNEELKEVKEKIAQWFKDQERVVREKFSVYLY
jgi:hypothetical protein